MTYFIFHWRIHWLKLWVFRSVEEYYLFAALCPPVEFEAQLFSEAVKLKFQMATVSGSWLGILPRSSGPKISCWEYNHIAFMKGIVWMVLYVWSGDAYVLVISMDSCILTAKPLSKPKLTYYERCSMASTWEQMHKMCSLTLFRHILGDYTLKLIPHLPGWWVKNSSGK